MNNSSQPDRLVALADNTLFVLGAYFFAFFPWSVANNIDFISEKWRTINRTRKLACVHLCCSIAPVLYVAAYAEAQRRVADSKELGAALAALFFNLAHLLRTLVGVTQLNAFLIWCTDAIQCMRAMQGKCNDDKAESGSGGGGEEEEEDDDDDEDDVHVNDELMVNNTVVDNELGGTDVTVRLSLYRMWEGLKKWEWKPSSWLVTEHASLCTVRWGGAFLCGLGEKWRGGDKFSCLDSESLTLFFSMDFKHLLKTLQYVTWNIGDADNEVGDTQTFSINELSTENGLELDARSTAYGTNISRYLLHETFDSYALEFEALRSSFPASNSAVKRENREGVAVGLVHSVILAKHLGFQRLKRIRRYYNSAKIPTNALWRHACRLLLEQCCSVVVSGNDVRMKWLFGAMNNIPLFPYRMQMVALWDSSTNWRVLQASVHEDIQTACISGSLFTCWFDDHHERNEKFGLFQLDERPNCIFEFCRQRALAFGNQISGPGCIGVVMESVRSFFAEWLVFDEQRIPDWEPIVPMDDFEFIVCDYLKTLDENPSVFQVTNRLIWECQRALQSELAKCSIMHPNLPTNTAMIMLFILGLPVMEMEEVNEFGDVSRFWDESDIEKSYVTSSSYHSSVNLSMRQWRVSSILAPENISLLIRLDLQTHCVSIRLICEDVKTRFIWQDWIDAAMGYMKGYYESNGEWRRKNDVEKKCGIRKSNLKRPRSMVPLSPMVVVGDEENSVIVKTNCVRVWVGWSTFDVRVCKFEMDQWLKACHIDLNNLVLDEWGDNELMDSEVEMAKKVIEAVVLEFDNES